jgi:hypothetical protein
VKPIIEIDVTVASWQWIPGDRMEFIAGSGGCDEPSGNTHSLN